MKADVARDEGEHFVVRTAQDRDISRNSTSVSLFNHSSMPFRLLNCRIVSFPGRIPG